MIVYSSGPLGFQVLFRIHGSAAYKAIIPAIVSTVFYLIIYFGFDWEEPYDEGSWFVHPYPMSTIMVVFTFLLTFKTSFSYNRYWEACTAIHQMHSKWLDVGMSIAAFHLQSNKFDAMKPPAFGSFSETSSIVRERERNNTMTSPELFETVFQLDQPSTTKSKKRFLRNKKPQDGNFDTKVVHSFDSISSRSHIPVPSQTNYNESRDYRNAVPRQCIRRLKSGSNLNCGEQGKKPSLFLQESVHLLSLLSAVAFSTLRNDIEAAESPLTAWEPGSPWPPVDPDDKDAITDLRIYDLPHWIKIFNFMFGLTRSPAQRTLYNACRPFMVLGGVSDAEITLLKSAHGPLAKTALCTMWLQEFLSREFMHGSLGKVDPPIVSRMYQYTSDGMIGYNQARKIAYIPFPFVHNQLTACYVLVLLIFFPILMVSYVKVPAVGAVLNAFTVSIFAGLYEVAREMEDPFRNVPNDIPLNNFHAQFNEALISMYAGFHPESWWEVDSKDVIPRSILTDKKL